jgi:hypothetical protein
MLAEKLLSTACIGLVVGVMSAINEEFRLKLVELASGGLMQEASSLSSRTTKWLGGMMDSVGAYGGDHNWLLMVAVGGAVVGAVWMLRW